MPPLLWRQATIADVPSIHRLSSTIHPYLPEDASIFAERIHLFPAGCLVLTGIPDAAREDLSPDTDITRSSLDIIYGYVISHPIRENEPPQLNSLLHAIDPDANQYYIHDLAILPVVRGGGLARGCMEMLDGVAARYASTCLVSVYGTGGFWGRFGFRAVEEMDGGLVDKMKGYGEDAVFLVRKNETRIVTR